VDQYRANGNAPSVDGQTISCRITYRHHRAPEFNAGWRSL